MVDKLKKPKSKEKKPEKIKYSPTKLSITAMTREGEQNIGSMSWDGEMWILDEGASDMLGDFLAGGRTYGGKVYTVQDHELYLPLTRSRYSGIIFEIAK